MKWIKQGLIFCANQESDWIHSHAMIPTPVLFNKDFIRVYLTFCDKEGIGRTGFVDLDYNNPKNIIKISDKPLIDIGKPGTFDENGVLACSVVSFNNNIYIYYAGFEIGTQIRYKIFLVVP